MLFRGPMTLREELRSELERMDASQLERIASWFGWKITGDERSERVARLIDEAEEDELSILAEWSQTVRGGPSIPPPLELGTLVDRYRVEKLLGAGPGVVSALVTHNSQNFVLRSCLATEPVDARRWWVASRAVGRLVASGWHEGRPWTLRRFSEKASAGECLEALTSDQAWSMIETALEQLARIHERGWVHGGVKASNLFEDGLVDPATAQLVYRTMFCSNRTDILSLFEILREFAQRFEWAAHAVRSIDVDALDSVASLADALEASRVAANSSDMAHRSPGETVDEATPDVATLQRLADEAYESGPADEAAELFRLLIAGGELGYANHWRYGDALLREQDWESAILPLEHAHALEPTKLEPLTGLIRAHRELGRWERAAELLRSMVELEPSATRWIELGDLQNEQLDDSDAALISYRSAWAATQDSLARRSIANKLMAIYGARKEWKPLIETVAQMAELTPDLVQASKFRHMAGALAERELGDLELAIQHYRASSERASFESLRDILAAQARWSELVDVYRARIAAGTGESKMSDALALFELLVKHLDDDEAALSVLESVRDGCAPDELEQLARSVGAAKSKPRWRHVLESIGEQMVELDPLRAETYRFLSGLEADWLSPYRRIAVALGAASSNERAAWAEARAPLGGGRSTGLVAMLDVDPELAMLFRRIAPRCLEAAPSESVELEGSLRETFSRAAERYGWNGVLVLGRRDSDALSFRGRDGQLVLTVGTALNADWPVELLETLASWTWARATMGRYARLDVQREWLTTAIDATVFPVEGAPDHISDFRKKMGDEKFDSEVDALASRRIDLRKWARRVDERADRAALLDVDSLGEVVSLIGGPTDEQSRLSALIEFVRSARYREQRASLRRT